MPSVYVSALPASTGSARRRARSRDRPGRRRSSIASRCCSRGSDRGGLSDGHGRAVADRAGIGGAVTTNAIAGGAPAAAAARVHVTVTPTWRTSSRCGCTLTNVAVAGSVSTAIKVHGRARAVVGDGRGVRGSSARRDGIGRIGGAGDRESAGRGDAARDGRAVVRRSSDPRWSPAIVALSLRSCPPRPARSRGGIRDRRQRTGRARGARARDDAAGQRRTSSRRRCAADERRARRQRIGHGDRWPLRSGRRSRAHGIGHRATGDLAGSGARRATPAPIRRRAIAARDRRANCLQGEVRSAVAAVIVALSVNVPPVVGAVTTMRDRRLRAGRRGCWRVHVTTSATGARASRRRSR